MLLPPTNMLVFWSACLSYLPVCRSNFSGSFRSQGKYWATLEFKSPGCAVSNNFISDSSLSLSVSVLHSVHTPPPLSKGQRGEGWASNQILKKRGSAGPQLLEGVAGKEEVTFSGGRGGCNCHIINQNLKYLMTEKVYKPKYFSL